MECVSARRHDDLLKLLIVAHADGAALIELTLMHHWQLAISGRILNRLSTLHHKTLKFQLLSDLCYDVVTLGRQIQVHLLCRIVLYGQLAKLERSARILQATIYDGFLLFALHLIVLAERNANDAGAEAACEQRNEKNDHVALVCEHVLEEANYASVVILLFDVWLLIICWLHGRSGCRRNGAVSARTGLLRLTTLIGLRWRCRRGLWLRLQLGLRFRFRSRRHNHNELLMVHRSQRVLRLKWNGMLLYIETAEPQIVPMSRKQEAGTVLAEVALRLGR